MVGIQRKAVVIGVDALTWELYRALRDQGYLKGVEKLLSRGALKGAARCIPPSTPPMWTSIASGVNPGKHGIMGFFSMNDLGVPRSLNTSLDVKVPRLHEIISYEGGKSLIGGLPLTTKPLVPFRGVFLPDRFIPEAKARPGSVERLFRARLLEAENALGYEEEAGICRAAVFDKALAETMLDILDEEGDFNLVFTVFGVVDSFMHIKPEAASDLGKVRCATEALDSIDRLVDFIVERYEGDGMILVVSDHGITPVESAVAVNKILYDEGLLSIRWRSREASIPRLHPGNRGFPARLGRILTGTYNLLANIPGLNMALYVLGRALVRRSRYLAEASRDAVRPLPDPESSTAYMEASVYGGIYVNERLADDVDSTVDRVIRVLSRVSDKLGVKLFEYVGRGRGEVIWGPHERKAPHVLVVPARGYALAYSVTRSYIVPSTLRGNHTMLNMHVISLPEHSGPLYKAAKMIEYPWDYANIVLAYLGIPVPSYADGRVASFLKGVLGVRDYRARYRLAQKLAARLTVKRERGLESRLRR